MAKDLRKVTTAIVVIIWETKLCELDCKLSGAGMTNSF